MSEFLSFLVALLLLPYVVVPILIRRNQYFSLTPNIRPIINGFLPPFIEDSFNKVGGDLQPFGFEHRIDAVSLDYGPNIRVFIRLYVASSRSIMAICTALLPDGEKKSTQNYLEFCSRFADGREISTHNSDMFSAPIEHRQKTLRTLPFVHDVRVLLAVHQNMHDRAGRATSMAYVPPVGQEFDFLVQSFKTDLNRQASLGCLELDASTNCYRPTWAGAFLIGWCSMWPISQIRRLWQRIRARFVVRGIEKVNA